MARPKKKIEEVIEKKEEVITSSSKRKSKKKEEIVAQVEEIVIPKKRTRKTEKIIETNTKEQKEIEVKSESAKDNIKEKPKRTRKSKEVTVEVIEEPKSSKQPRKKKETEKPVRQIGKEQPESQPQPEETEKGGSLLDFLPLVKTVFSFLGDFRRKLRVDKLQLKLIMAGGDPYNLALNYGRAWAALGNLLPKLEQWFVIKDRDLEVECDFTASDTVVIARLDITITLGRLLAAVLRFAFRALAEFLKIMKKRKGGANQ